jgi:hypothetical protein
VATAASSSSNSNANNNPGHSITVTGDSPAGLAPGVTKQLMVTVKNPNNQDAQVTSVTIGVGNASGACPAAGNITTTSYSSSTTGARVFIAPKNGSVQVPLLITMLNTNSKQDPCENARFPLTFTATVTNNG